MNREQEKLSDIIYAVLGLLFITLVFLFACYLMGQCAYGQEKISEKITYTHQHWESDTVIYDGDYEPELKYCTDGHYWIYGDAENNKLPRICEICYRKELLRGVKESYEKYEMLDHIVNQLLDLQQKKSQDAKYWK